MPIHNEILIQNIDLELLTKQKIELVNVIQSMSYNEPQRTSTIDALGGILNTLDHITDADIEDRILSTVTIEK